MHSAESVSRENHLTNLNKQQQQFENEQQYQKALVVVQDNGEEEQEQEQEEEQEKEDRKFVFENTFKKLWRSKHRHHISLDHQRHFLEPPPALKRFSDITPSASESGYFWEDSKIKLHNSSSASTSLVNLPLPSSPILKQNHISGKSFERGLNVMETVSNGSWLFKFTRKIIGNSISNNKKHQRFFWIHPHSKTLYWSEQEPGSIKTELTTKSALIESFVILDKSCEKSSVPSILIKTSQRNIRVQCLDMTTHRIWSEALAYLVKTNRTPSSFFFINSGARHSSIDNSTLVNLPDKINTSNSNLI